MRFSTPLESIIHNDPLGLHALKWRDTNFKVSSSGMLQRIIWETNTDVSKKCGAFETAVTLTRRNFTEDLNLQQCFCKHLKFCPHIDLQRGTRWHSG